MPLIPTILIGGVKRKFPGSSHLRSKFHLAGRVRTEFTFPGSGTQDLVLLLQVFHVCLLISNGCKEGSSNYPLSKLSTQVVNVLPVLT